MAGLHLMTNVVPSHNQNGVLLVISDQNYQMRKEIKSLLEGHGLRVCGVDSIPGLTVYEELDILLHSTKFTIFYCSEELLKDELLFRVIENIVYNTDTDLNRCITLLSSSNDLSRPLCLACTTIIQADSARWKDELVSFVRANTIKQHFYIRMTSKPTLSHTIMESNLASESITYDIFGIRFRPRNENAPESPVLKVNLDVFQREMATNSEENIIQICNTFEYFPAPEVRLKLILQGNERYELSTFTDLASLFSKVCPLEELIGMDTRIKPHDNIVDETTISRLCLVEGQVTVSVETVVSNIYKSVGGQINQAINQIGNSNTNMFLQSLKDFENRKRTFDGRWDETNDLPVEFLASAGFFLNPFGRLICHCCQFMLNRNTEQRYIPAWHVQTLPSCKFAVKYQNDSVQTPKLASVEVATRNNAYLSYTLPESRVRSFESILPKLKERFGPRCQDIIELIAEAGFHCSDRVDFVRCYSCGREISVMGLDKSNIWSLHAGMSPKCLHVLNTKGKQWIDDIQSARRDSTCASSVTFFLKMSGERAIERSWHKHALYMAYVNN